MSLLGKSRSSPFSRPHLVNKLWVWQPQNCLEHPEHRWAAIPGPQQSGDPQKGGRCPREPTHPPPRAGQGQSWALPPRRGNPACSLSRGTLTCTYLSHSEQLVFQSYEYVDCRGNMSVPHSLAPHPP